MAKKDKEQKTDPNEGWEEVGDHWDDIHEFKKAKDELAGVLLNVAAEVGPNESNVYIIGKDGVRYGVWGSAILDRRMASVNVGDQVKMVYLGEEESPKTGRTFKDFKVYRKPGQIAPSEDIPF